MDWTGGLDWWTGLVTGLVDWTGGLTLKSLFMASNKTYWPLGLHDAHATFYTQSDYDAKLIFFQWQ